LVLQVCKNGVKQLVVPWRAMANQSNGTAISQ